MCETLSSASGLCSQVTDACRIACSSLRALMTWLVTLERKSRQTVSARCVSYVKFLFTAVLQTAEKGKAVASSDAFYAADTSDPVTDWQDYSNFYDEYDDDEEVRSCR